MLERSVVCTTHEYLAVGPEEWKHIVVVRGLEAAGQEAEEVRVGLEVVMQLVQVQLMNVLPKELNVSSFAVEEQRALFRLLDEPRYFLLIRQATPVKRLEPEALLHSDLVAEHAILETSKQHSFAAIVVVTHLRGQDDEGLCVL